MTITQGTDPWSIPDAVYAAELAQTHRQAVQLRAMAKSARSAERALACQEWREGHQTNTGWLAEHMGEGRWKFYYTDPATREQGGQTITWTTGEER